LAKSATEKWGTEKYSESDRLAGSRWPRLVSHYQDHNSYTFTFNRGNLSFPEHWPLTIENWQLTGKEVLALADNGQCSIANGQFGKAQFVTVLSLLGGALCSRS
jgi:hypothetical protein